MLAARKITYEDDELQKKIEEAVVKLDQSADVIEFPEVCCYPITDGCCIKAGDGRK